MVKRSSRSQSTSQSDQGKPGKGTDPSHSSKGAADAVPNLDKENVCSPRINVQRHGGEIWTMSQMLDAEPVPLPVVEEDEPQLDSMQRADSNGSSDEGGRPKISTDTADDFAPQASTGGYDYPAPFTRFNVIEQNYLLYPYCSVGKVFFRQGSNRYVGSAFSIGNNAVFTAGHCVHAGNGRQDGWFEDFVFVPAYRDGQAPFGQWPASFLMTRTRWYDSGIPNGLTEDLGGAVVQQVGGRKLSDVVGYLGFSWNQSRFQHWHAMGYPAGAPFDGKVMVTTQASYAYDGQVAGIKPMAIGSDMTGGCSGGPWIRNFLTANQANGLNSYRRSSHGQEMLSPYFDDRAKSLKDDLVAANP